MADSLESEISARNAFRKIRRQTFKQPNRA